MRAGAKWLAIVLIGSITAQCASVPARAVQTVPPAERGATVLAAAQKMPVGSRVSVALASGRRFNATLLGVDERMLIVQERTRLPEPPLRIDAQDVVFLELDTPRGGVAKMIALGAAIGTGATLAFLAMLAAAMGD